MSERGPIHLVFVETIGDPFPRTARFDSAAEADRYVEGATREPDAWHVFHAVETPDGERSVMLSLYRSPDRSEWLRLWSARRH